MHGYTKGAEKFTHILKKEKTTNIVLLNIYQ